MTWTRPAVGSAIVAFALLSPPALAAITFVNGASRDPGTTSASVAVPISTTAGNDVVVVITYDIGGSPTPSVTDTGGSSYAFRAGLTNAPVNQRVEIWSARNVAASTQVTVSFTPAAFSPGVSVLQYAGVAVLGSTSTSTGNSANPHLSLTTQDASNVVVGGFEIDNVSAISANQGSLRTKAQAGGYGVCGTDNTAATASAVTTGVTIATATSWVAAALELRSGGATSFPLTVSKAGTGTGTVTSSPAGIACGGTCSASYAAGTVVTLTEVPDAGSTFAGWSGDCTGTQSTCTLTMSAARSATATFQGTGGGGTGIIPADRATTWNPGIPGGVPARTAICGATVNPPAGDATALIQSALDSCTDGQVVQLGAGTFNLTDSLFLRKGIVLRGAGPSQTRLVTSAPAAAPIVMGTQWFTFTQSTNLASGAVKGTNTAVLISVAGLSPPLAAGEIVLVDTITNALTEWSPNSPPDDPSRAWFCRANRPISQVMEIQSVSGTTVTFTTPFHIGFATADQAQLSRFTVNDGTVPPPVKPSVKFAGVEDLYVFGGQGGQGNIQVENCAYCWVKNVESDFQDGAAVSLDASFRSVLRDSYIHSTRTPSPGGGGYGISFAFGSADNLVENNISWNMNKVMVMRSSGGGNVIGYNYMQDGWIDDYPDWVEVGLNASHMTTPHYELFEGNESFNFDGDNTWGNAIYITAFRNHLTTHRRAAGPLATYSKSCGVNCTQYYEDADNRRGIGLMSGHQWYTFVGNVIGYAGMSNPPIRSTGHGDLGGFEYSKTDFQNDNMISMWQVGYDPGNWAAPPDPRVTSTVIRDGNFDFFTNTVNWDRPQQAIPSSLYLTSPPSFFSGYTWPWVDPLGATTKTYRLPARDRFDLIQGLPQGGSD
ncbi:MAG: InlB B-repeat-containing protein [Myxococcales bacterium]